MKVMSVEHERFIKDDLRLDAGYHLSDGRLMKLSIEKAPFPIETIGNVTERIFYGGRSRRLYVDSIENGIPFMGSSDMLKADFTSLKFISKKHTPNLTGYLLEEGWTLVSRSGTIGNTVYVNKNFQDKAASEHIIRVVPKKSIKSGFLFAYLSSKYGYGLLTQGTFGAVIQHIEPNYISSLPIPILPDDFQCQIHELVKQASELRVTANRLLDEAKNAFIKKLGLEEKLLKKLTFPYEETISNKFEIDFFKVNTKTLRGRNYSKRKDTIVNILKSVNYDKLSDVLVAPPHYGARFKRIESLGPNGIELLSQGDIFDLKPKGENDFHQIS